MTPSPAPDLAADSGGRRVSVAHIALALPWVALVIAARAPIRDNSFLWHVRAGTVQIDSGQVLTTDPFSFTAGGEPWRTQSWLAELLYGWAERWIDLGFVPWMVAATSLVLFTSIGTIAYLRSRSIRGSALTLVLSTILLLAPLAPRPVIFSFVLFALVILAWERPSTQWAVPLLLWVWAATHGSFVIGGLYLVVTALARRDRKAVPVIGLSALLTLLTAHGLGVVEILLDFSRSSGALALVSEWATPDFLTPTMAPFLAGTVIVMWGAMSGRVVKRDLFIIVPALVLGATATRAVPLAWLALLPLIAHSVGSSSIRGGFSRVAAAAFFLVIVILPFLIGSGSEIDEDWFPVAAAMALEPLATFHDDSAGGYLIYSMWPEHEVFIDDRAELFGGRVAEFVELRHGGGDWRHVFARDGIEQVLLRVSDGLVGRLLDSGWGVTYRDDLYAVLRP